MEVGLRGKCKVVVSVVIKLSVAAMTARNNDNCFVMEHT